ncbi:uncharacterized protein B0T15DRAFT_516882 [Chaetomium strumarium]|uniref:Uncharacterized protein n=1 Tax=Chaetomium strumarium TaxID=1170767 RepID=A0AAJ0H171_9PEZI|nr:hypothetical protein B0T15DRAFT_516882 [Chaetomium strumarium]
MLSALFRHTLYYTVLYLPLSWYIPTAASKLDPSSPCRDPESRPWAAFWTEVQISLVLMNTLCTVRILEVCQHVRKLTQYVNTVLGSSPPFSFTLPFRSRFLGPYLPCGPFDDECTQAGRSKKLP